MICRSFIFLVVLGVLCGCAPTAIYTPCSGKALPHLLDATALKPIFYEMAYELCTEGCFDCSDQDVIKKKLNSLDCSNNTNKRQTVLVTDFVDLKSYVPGDTGLLFGEMMRGGLSQSCCYKIVQAEFGKYFKLNENGIISLTRRITEIKNDEYDQQEAVVGTYNFMNSSKIVLFVRRINTETGHVIKMVTREIDYKCLGRNVIYSIQ